MRVFIIQAYREIVCTLLGHDLFEVPFLVGVPVRAYQCKLCKNVRISA